jgi:tRNA(Ile)-lysidine synthase
MPKKIVPRKSAPAQKNAGRSRSDLAARLIQHLKEKSWAQAGQRIGVAVSGGADSVALFLILLELRESLGIVLSAVHFNHRLRGRSSKADQNFVSKLAARYGIPCFIASENISAKSKRDGGNLEEVARRARYAYFEHLVAEGNLDKIAVAHTADDQAETVLAHILRGTGIAGLGGIHPEFGCVFRPLLKFRRAELRSYLRARSQTWREDATNRDTRRMRARIRLKLVPVLEKQFQTAVVEHLCQLADVAREDQACLEGAAELRLLFNAKEENGEWRISPRDLLDSFLQEGPTRTNVHHATLARSSNAISKRLIRLLVKKVKSHAGQLGAKHVDAVLCLAQQPDSGKTLHLPGAVEVRRQRDMLCFRSMARQPGKTNSEPEPYSYTVELGPLPAEVRVPGHPCFLRFTVIDWPPQGRETRPTGAVLDRKRIGLPLVVRNWRPGDSIHPVGHQKHHRLSRLLTEIGVSRWDKLSWPVLTSAGKVVWSRGLPVSVEAAAGSFTRNGVMITEVSDS